jgi:hypothetical protein
VHGGPHAGVDVADPPGSGAARHSFLEPHAGPRSAEPHSPSRDRVRQPMAAQPHAGRRAPGRIRSEIGGSDVAGEVLRV